LVEHAPTLRSSGHVIDFWGLRYEIAERMGLASEINRIGYHMRELRIVDSCGERVTGFGTSVFRELTGGRFVTVGRSDLSRLLFEKIKGTTDVLFGDEIVGLEEDANGVRAKFKHADERQFDLVIGAHGLHSKVQELIFGPENRFEKQLGYVVAAFDIRGYRPRDEDVYVIYSRPAGCLDDLHCMGIGRCFCSFSQRLSVCCPSLIYLHRRRSYVSGLTTGPGNAREFLGNSTIHMIFILIALARSRWTAGPGVALHS
jgi:2-polyprenyl-6-methoxyphenol hydroxylase-like FAD-dependent oxidoreductase